MPSRNHIINKTINPRSLVIKTCRGKDLERILSIESAGFGKEAWDRNTFAYYLEQPTCLFLMAWRGRSAVGYLLACTRAKRAELVSVAVVPAARRVGVASAMLESLMRRLNRRDVTRLVLAVKVTNRGALAFYERYDFRKIRRVARYYEDGSDGWMMEREI